MEKIFFSNAIMGLREEGTALTKKSWQNDKKFSSFCGEFLNYQLAQIKPKLTVVMGPDSKLAFDAFARNSHVGDVLYIGHPYADFNLSADRRAKDIDALRAAWSN